MSSVNNDNNTLNENKHNNSKVPLKILDPFPDFSKDIINKKNKSDDPNIYREVNKIQICKNSLKIF